MSNIVYVALPIFISFIMSAIFMSSYKEDFKNEYNSDKNFIYTLIRNHADEISILKARIYDLETKLKEMENHNDR